MLIRKAVMSDTESIYKLISEYAKEGKLLARTYSSIYENLQSFLVAVLNNEVVGITSLTILDQNLAEVRSLAVSPAYVGKGIGKALVLQIIKETENLEITKLISLTYQIEFFSKIGFNRVDKNELPQKMWKDCINCPKLHSCDETAMLLNVLP
ncbi:N-acetyltransferase [Neobacillus ginsengisoli]|uniref:Amino-acid N-acetyltransferase n=1 Tax=Neobacillus ginsengisoli TaxID=904295 RepID=A0ABT9XQZ5_9BACI|nr:N-acetyltransferase [Neobacillus ginsengisoli]MDQ0197975.1 amino-acid N-acetyltransferase [Neobacillus ginsengisoli]